ncbi:DnaJ family domain-containing protein [Paenibacillus sp. GCM10023250]|uniref:DnaJ family domain-containing protein n=1 Tax=Paenibacillus sp. GCM10023250 TaxID=3252648 RepID=UPI0036218151
MFLRSNKRKSKLANPNAREALPGEALPGDAQSDGDGQPDAGMEVVSSHETGQAEASARSYWNAGVTVHDWVSEIFQDEWKKGTFDDLPGKGKPIDVPSGDITNGLLRQANFLPGWLTLQHDIRDRLRQWLLRAGSGSDEALEDELREINAMIVKYNGMVPHAALQKLTITRENASRLLSHWE